MVDSQASLHLKQDFCEVREEDLAAIAFFNIRTKDPNLSEGCGPPIVQTAQTIASPDRLLVNAVAHTGRAFKKQTGAPAKIVSL